MIKRNTIIRLSTYRSALIRFKKLGFTKVFSDDIADAASVTSAQVRKDFSIYKILGNKKGGYELELLINQLNIILGKNEKQRVIIAGVGKLGTALLKYQGFEKEGLEIVAAFDIDSSKINKKNGIPVLSFDELPETAKKYSVEIGILAVPEIAAQDVADIMVKAGIKGILNFAPILLKCPSNVVISNVNLAMELENVIYFTNLLKSGVSLGTNHKNFLPNTQISTGIDGSHIQNLSKITKMDEKFEELNKKYIDMIGFVSHELKGVLSSTIINVYSLKDGFLGKLNELQQKAIESTAKTLNHFESMVNNYLDFSRIEQGRLNISKSEFLLNENVLLPIISYLEKQIQSKSFRLTNDTPNGIKLSADKNLITVACSNLLSNAIKYGNENGEIHIKTIESEDNISIIFYNDGTPIDINMTGSLFKRFSRLPGSEKVKGTGLGLFIVKEIASRHGGDITVTPKHTGNEFCLTIKKQ